MALSSLGAGFQVRVLFANIFRRNYMLISFNRIKIFSYLYFLIVIITGGHTRLEIKGACFGFWKNE